MRDWNWEDMEDFDDFMDSLANDYLCQQQEVDE